MQQAREFVSIGRRYAEENGAGLAVSLLLHGVLAFLVLYTVARHVVVPIPTSQPIVPVDLIRLGDETRSPPAELRSVVPQQKAGRPQEAASPTREAVSPTGKKAP